MVRIDIKKSKECNGEYSMFISFPYDNTLVSTIREFPSRYWHKNDKKWELPLNKFDALLPHLKNFEVEINYAFGCEVIKETKPVNVSEFSFKTKPFNHQVDGYNFGMSHDRWLLGDEQGLGKTKQVIDIAVAKKQSLGYKHCLIICGVNGLKWNWLNEISIHSNESGFILGQRNRCGKTLIGTTANKLEDLVNIDKLDKFYFLITNVESLRDDKIQSIIAKYCSDGTIDMVAIDEIHKCKNPSSQQGKGILKVQPECRIAMTGTPLMNTPLDLYIILKWLGYEKHPFYSFRKYYCVMGGFGGYEVVGYKNIDELQEQVQDIMLRRLKEDVLDLPNKLFIDEFVEMTPKQEQLYKEICADVKANIDKIAMSNNPLAELIRLRQATGYTGILSSNILESAKTERLIEILDEAVANNKKVVIFSNWTQITNYVTERLSSRYRGCSITGETPDADRQRYVEEFQNNDSIKYIIGTIGAMGTGLTLTAGTIVVFLDEPWNMALKEQAIDRCHRIGTTQNVTVYTMMCKNTIDERIHSIVTKKGAMSDALIDGKVVGNKTELLNFLLS